MPYVLDPVTLATQRMEDFGLQGVVGFSAHYKVMLPTSSFNLLLSLLAGYLTYFSMYGNNSSEHLRGI